MEYFAGLDVSLETVNVCIVNAAGDVLLEKKIAAEPATIVSLPDSMEAIASKPSERWRCGSWANSTCEPPTLA